MVKTLPGTSPGMVRSTLAKGGGLSANATGADVWGLLPGRSCIRFTLCRVICCPCLLPNVNKYIMRAGMERTIMFDCLLVVLSI